MVIEEDRQCDNKQIVGSNSEMDLKTSEDVQTKHEDETVGTAIQTKSKPPVGFSITYNVKIKDHDNQSMNSCEFCSF